MGCFGNPAPQGLTGNRESTRKGSTDCALPLFRRLRFYSKVEVVVLARYWSEDFMPRPVGPILKTLLFTILVPGFVALRVPYDLLGQKYLPGRGSLAGLGILCIILGAGMYFRCAWEFAVRGLGTPAPIAPTKFLVVSALHCYMRNPMYVGVLLVILGQAALFHAPRLAAYGALCILLAHLFVLLYEESTLHRQFGESYDEYRRTVPRWIPRFRK